MKRGVVKRLQYHVKLLTALVFLQVGTFATLAKETGGQFYQRQRKVDVMEIWGGHAEVSYQAAEQGWWATSPYDIKYGIDLKYPEERQALLDDIDRLAPRLVLCEFPCHLWGRWRGTTMASPLSGGRS